MHLYIHITAPSKFMHLFFNPICSKGGSISAHEGRGDASAASTAALAQCSQNGRKKFLHHGAVCLSAQVLRQKKTCKGQFAEEALVGSTVAQCA